MAAKLKIDLSDHKNRFMRFTPTISMGNIITATSIIVAATTAWMQMHNEITRLTSESIVLESENVSRKNEIKDALAKQDQDREELYKKIASDHAETMNDIKQSQKDTHEDVKEIAQAMGTRFDHIEDKLDKKRDK